MKISVVIPVYNEEKYIKNCLDSLMNQEEKPNEIIVVDNNCTDKTISIVKKFKDITVIQEKNQGMIPARNAGYNCASGEIIARCDADSLLPSNWIKRIKKDFENKQTVGFSNSFVFYDLPIINRSSLPSKLFYFFFKIILGFYTLIGPAMAIKKDVWKKVKNEVCLDDKKVHEDIDLSIHIKEFGNTILDKNAIVKISGRRIKHNLLSFFVEYPWRLIKMMISHRK